VTEALPAYDLAAKLAEALECRPIVWPEDPQGSDFDVSPERPGDLADPTMHRLAFEVGAWTQWSSGSGLGREDRWVAMYGYRGQDGGEPIALIQIRWVNLKLQILFSDERGAVSGDVSMRANPCHPRPPLPFLPGIEDRRWFRAMDQAVDGLLSHLIEPKNMDPERFLAADMMRLSDEPAFDVTPETVGADLYARIVGTADCSRVA
jgi:hypothetical protein